MLTARIALRITFSNKLFTVYISFAILLVNAILSAFAVRYIVNVLYYWIYVSITFLFYMHQLRVAWDIEVFRCSIRISAIIGMVDFTLV